MVVADPKYDLAQLRATPATTMRINVPAQRKRSRCIEKPRPEKGMRPEKRSPQVVVKQNTDDLSCLRRREKSIFSRMPTSSKQVRGV